MVGERRFTGFELDRHSSVAVKIKGMVELVGCMGGSDIYSGDEMVNVSGWKNIHLSSQTSFGKKSLTGWELIS